MAEEAKIDCSKQTSRKKKAMVSHFTAILDKLKQQLENDSIILSGIQ